MFDNSQDFDSLFNSVVADESARIDSSHFARDCLWIVGHAQSSPDYLPGIAALVLLSIQQPFYLMPTYVADMARTGAKSRYLFGHKHSGFHYVQLFKRDLWRSATRCYNGKISLDDLILDYLAIPGLGIVKASFLAQMTVGQGACLDTLNLRAMGLRLDAFRTPKSLKVGSIRKRISTYNAVWSAQGDSCYWWDLWCDMLGARTHNARGAAIGSLGDGAAVSRTHRLAITGGIK